MKDEKLVALGVDNYSNQCCCIYSLATFDQLKENFELYAKSYNSTNWNGCDDIERTLALKKLRLTGRKFNAYGEYCGTDYDMGHEYKWTFTFGTVMEVIDGENE